MVQRSRAATTMPSRARRAGARQSSWLIGPFVRHVHGTPPRRSGSAPRSNPERPRPIRKRSCGIPSKCLCHYASPSPQPDDKSPERPGSYRCQAQPHRGPDRGHARHHAPAPGAWLSAQRRRGLHGARPHAASIGGRRRGVAAASPRAGRMRRASVAERAARQEASPRRRACGRPRNAVPPERRARRHGNQMLTGRRP